MARIRTIKPEFASDEKLARVSRDARLTFVLLVTQSDDDGLLPGRARQLLGLLYPHDEDVTAETLRGWLDELESIGAIRWRETHDEAPVVEIVNWSRHQKVDHKGKSLLLPTLRPFSDDTREVLAKSSREYRAPTVDHGPTTKDHGPTTDGDPEGFAACWSAYPKRAGGNSRALAVKAYRARLASGATPAELLAGTERYAGFIRASGREGTEYVKQASTFFGPGDHFREPWAPASAPVRNGNGQQARNLAVLREFVEGADGES